jgi:CubicO group peptidase (beta-lactamase class C family)
LIQPNMNRRALLLGAAGLGLSACATGRLPPRDTPGLPQTQAVLDRWIGEGIIPGVSVGVRVPDGADVFIQAGQIDFGTARAVDADSLFRIYSMTKPVTGAAAALLIEDGRLALDQPVSEIIPEFSHLTVALDPAAGLEARPVSNSMTIRHLLTHTSGLTYTITGDNAVQQAYRRAGIFPFTGHLAPQDIDGPRIRDLDEMAARLGDIPLVAEPGSAYNYSISLDVLGLVIQRASGLPLPTFVQRRLFDPIGMDDTVWRLRPGDAERLMQVYGFNPETRERVGIVPGVGAAEFSEAVTLYAGGAGLVSSARDYLAFLTTLLDDGRATSGAVMRPETARLIRSDILSPDLVAWGGGHGFGGWVARPGHRRQGEFGWSGAAGTQGWIDPERNFAATMMIQVFPYAAVPIIAEVRAAIDADLGIVRAG